MKIGIDASNIRAGGGITHLKELLGAAHPEEFRIDRVVVWAGSRTLEQLPQRPWLKPVSHVLLDGPLPSRLVWQRVLLERLLKDDFQGLFVPGGVYTGSFRPFVAMSQNLLPFDRSERQRFWPHLDYFRLALISHGQSKSFSSASGIIFLSPTARSVVLQHVPVDFSRTRTIPHGIDDRFRMAPRQQMPISTYGTARPLRLLYVSIITVYKHQWNVVEAVGRLRSRGLPVALDLVGPAYGPALKRLRRVMDQVDPRREFIRYLGPALFDDLHELYRQADVSVFASTCETFGQILLESMAAGLPIACSGRSSLPDVLGEDGVYFDPEYIDDIEQQLLRLVTDRDLRAIQARRAFARSKQFSWETCARETFEFVAASVASRR